MKFVVEAIGIKSGGGLEVTRNLVRSLARSGRHQFVVLLPDIPEYDGIGGMVSCVLRFPPNAGLIERYRFLNRAVLRICKEEQADALLCLGNFLPAKLPCPTVGFLQNAWYVYGEPTAWHRLTFREKLIVLYGRRLLATRSPAAHMIVQTEVMKKRLSSVLGGTGSEISVIPSVPLLRRLARDSKPGARLQQVFTFLCISHYAAHKNFEILLDAAKLLRNWHSHRFRCLLTIAPDQHPGARRLLKRIVRDGLEDLLVNIGPVPREKLENVYTQTDAHLLPTLLETFGLTYDEAMHFGLPILTSDREFAHERCQDAAIYFDPLDAESVAGAMTRIMEGSELRAGLVANGRRIISRSPTWNELAARFEDVLERVASGRPISDQAPKAAATFVKA